VPRTGRGTSGERAGERGNFLHILENLLSPALSSLKGREGEMRAVDRQV